MVTLPYFGLLISQYYFTGLFPNNGCATSCSSISGFVFLYLVDKWSILIVTGLTIYTYCIGIMIQRFPKRNYLYWLGVAGVLAALTVFKYMGFLTGIANSLSSFIETLPRFEIIKLLLPLGISYIVFKHISYLTDIKWGLVKPGKFLDFLLYSSLFTIFVAGPIERFERFKPQVEIKRIPFDPRDFEYGFMRIVIGLFKKLVLADWIGYFNLHSWNIPAEHSFLIKVIVLVGYSFQIYFDFSGYSDLAIGSSRLFGIRIMENFNNPYLAHNISQFWRRWHISLSDWIRDYIFFPLSRISSFRPWSMIATDHRHVLVISGMGLPGISCSGVFNGELAYCKYGMKQKET